MSEYSSSTPYTHSNQADTSHYSSSWSSSFTSNFDDNYDYSSEEDSSEEVEQEIRTDLGEFYGIGLHSSNESEKLLTAGIHLFHGIESALKEMFGNDWWMDENETYSAFQQQAENLLLARKQQKLSWEQFEQKLKANAGVHGYVRKFIQLTSSLFGRGSDPKYLAAMLKMMAKGVKYADEEKRKKYLIELGPVFMRGGKVFDTAKLCRHKRKTSEGGSAANIGAIKDKMAERCIWVMTDRRYSTDKLWYSHVSKLARFHHSSFSGGDCVEAAGEWYVENGKLLLINGASGHYRPEPKRLLKALEELNFVNALDRALISLFDNDHKEQRFEALEVKRYWNMYMREYSLF